MRRSGFPARRQRPRLIRLRCRHVGLESPTYEFVASRTRVASWAFGRYTPFLARHARFVKLSRLSGAKGQGMGSRSILNPILQDDRLTRGLHDPEARIL